MAKRVSAQRSMDRTIVRNAINRFQKALEEFAVYENGSKIVKSSHVMDMMNELGKLGIRSWDKPNAATLDRIIDDLKASGEWEDARSKLKNTDTVQDIYRKIQREIGIKPTAGKPYITKEERRALQKYEIESYDIDAWIASNLDVIYKYNEAHPNSTYLSKGKGSRDGKRTSYEDLYAMRAEIQRAIDEKELNVNPEDVKSKYLDPNDLPYN